MINQSQIITVIKNMHKKEMKPINKTKKFILIYHI